MPRGRAWHLQAEQSRRRWDGQQSYLQTANGSVAAAESWGALANSKLGVHARRGRSMRIGRPAPGYDDAAIAAVQRHRTCTLRANERGWHGAGPAKHTTMIFLPGRQGRS